MAVAGPVPAGQRVPVGSRRSGGDYGRPAGRVPSRSVSCDSAAPSKPAVVSDSSAWRRTASNGAGEVRRDQQQIRPRPRGAEPPLDVASPDSLSEFLDFHNRPPSNDCNGTRAHSRDVAVLQAALCSPAVTPAAATPAVSTQRSQHGKPPSRDREDTLGYRPPRAPLGGVAAGGIIGNGTCVTAGGRQRSVSGCRNSNVVESSGSCERRSSSRVACSQSTEEQSSPSRFRTASQHKRETVAPWGLSGIAQTATVVSLAQDANPNFRPYMEDGQKVLDPMLQSARESWGFFGVYDGHGGRSEVDYVEQKLHDVVMAELRSQPSDNHAVGGALVAAFKKIDGQLAMMGAWNSGCTATVALVHRKGDTRTLHVANVGDSRAVLVQRSGGVRRLSRDHRACDADEARRVVQEGGVVRHARVGGQLSVSRSLGDHHLKNSGVSCLPDICTCGVSGGDALIIASDGLWDALSDEDAGQVLRGDVEHAVAVGKDGGPRAIAECLRTHAAQALVTCAKERGSRDNILALVVFI